VCEGKITTVVEFLSYCLNFEVVSLVFMFPTARKMKFQMSFDLKTETAQSYRNGKILKEM
jgi:hypothetical protein